MQKQAKFIGLSAGGKEKYVLVHSFEYPRAFSWADTREGFKDRDKREYIRGKAAKAFPRDLPNIKRWAFRISVIKKGNGPFDIDNAPKLIIDSFCKWQIERDGSSHKELGLYENDTIDYVEMVNVAGLRGDKDFTKVEIFGSLED